MRVACLRTLANTDSRSIQDTLDFLAAKLNVTKDQALAQIAQSNFLKVPATVQDTANAAVLIASDRARMLTGTVVNATAGAALDLNDLSESGNCRKSTRGSQKSSMDSIS